MQTRFFQCAHIRRQFGIRRRKFVERLGARGNINFQLVQCVALQTDLFARFALDGGFLVAQRVPLAQRLVHIRQLLFERLDFFFVPEYVGQFRLLTAARDRTVRTEHLAVARYDLKAVARLASHRDRRVHGVHHHGVAK